MKIFNVKLFIIFLSAYLISQTTPLYAKMQLANVSGFARSYPFNHPLPDGTITVLETNQKITTDNQGRFGPIHYPIGQPITLIFEKKGYQTTQSATIIVPPQGLTGPYDNITFQVPSTVMFFLLSKIVGADFDEEACHVATTITSYHKTLDDIPQGEPNAQVILDPVVSASPFYFGIFKNRLLKDQTNPFTKGLMETTADGGVGFYNLPPQETPYKISAVKKGIRFTEAMFICRKGVFINISPPRGPMALG